MEEKTVKTKKMTGGDADLGVCDSEEFILIWDGKRFRCNDSDARFSNDNSNGPVNSRPI